MEQKKDKKSNAGLIIGIIVGVIILFFCGLGLILFIATKSVNSTIQKSKENSFLDTYNSLRKEVQIKLVNGENPTCDDDCALIYDYDRSDFDFEVTKMGSYYKIQFEVDDDKYDNFRFSNEKCNALQDSVCDENEIVGRVYNQ